MLRKIISSWWTTLILLLVYAVAMGIATFVEAHKGTVVARELVYHSVLFMLLHLCMVINFIALSVKQKLFSRKMWGTLLLHYGFVVIIIGAFVTHVFGYEGLMHIREGQTSQTILIDKKITKEIPVRVTLNNFILERYHGSNSPSSFKSDVVIEYKNEKKNYSIYMNNIAHAGGLRFYQTSYDPDELGTVLTVNSDLPGTIITYIGYVLLIIGLFLSMFSSRSRFRYLSKAFGTTAMIVFCLFLSESVLAQSRFYVPGQEHAERFGQLLVQSSDGRIKPINTFSSEILRKIYHKDTYKGYTSDQVLIGLITDPEGWADEPIIYTGRKQYRSYNSLFDENGDYTLSAQAEKVSAKAPGERTKEDKDVLKLDEKANILFALFSKDFLSIFPVEGREKWYSAGEDLSLLAPKDSMFVGRILEWYTSELLNRQTGKPDEVLTIIEKYQQAKTAHLNIDEKKIDAEIFYNKADFFRISFRLYLLLGLAILLSLIFTSKKTHRYFSWIKKILFVSLWGVILFQTIGIALRWYISGRAPWTNGYESIIYVGWVTALAGMFFYKRAPLVMALSSLLAGVTLFVANLNWLDPEITPLVPVLKSYWLMIHVSVVTASYGLFGISAMCGIGSLLSIICKKENSQLRIINEIAILVGLALLTAGIFFGAVWANESWGRYWGWDPKETWALITMIIYAVIVHLRFIPALNNNFWFSVFSVIGILCVLMTYFGVNYYLSGLHSYSNTGEVPITIIWSIFSGVTLLFVWAAWRYYKKK